MLSKTMFSDNKLEANIFDFETLLQKTIVTSAKLVEYFRMNLIYYQLVSGKGLEFDRIRNYTVGDDVKRIDWKIFAKRGKLLLRSYKEERQFDIVMVMDVSDTMLLGTTQYTKNQYAALVAGTLAFAANEAGDLSAISMFSDKVELALDPDNDFSGVMAVMSNQENYGGKKNWEKLSDSLISTYAQDSIIFLISDFIDTDPELFLPDLSSYFSKVYGIMVRDPVDDQLPKKVGRMYLKNTDNKYLCMPNLSQIRDQYSVLCKRNIEKVRETFHKYGQLFFRIHTDEEFATSFIQALGAEEVVIY